MDFLTDEALSWIIETYLSCMQQLEVSNILMDLCLAFSRCYLMHWSVVLMFLSAVWTLNLTAPIHFRGFIGEQMISCYISQNLMKKLTHLHLG